MQPMLKAARGSVQYTSNLTMQWWLLEEEKEKQTHLNKSNSGLQDNPKF